VNLFLRDTEEDDCSDWMLPSGDGSELIRLARLGVGPFEEKTFSEQSSRMNHVRMIVWPSGHVLWCVEGEGSPGGLRSRKGRIMEYRFGMIDFDKTREQIEAIINADKPLQGYHRESILFEDHGAYEAYFVSGWTCDLVVLDPKYIFKCVSQVQEERDEAFYEKWRLSTEHPRRSVTQLLAIRKVLTDSLPTDSYKVLTSEPQYFWKGRTDVSEEATAVPGSKQRRRKTGSQGRVEELEREIRQLRKSLARAEMEKATLREVLGEDD